MARALSTRPRTYLKLVKIFNGLAANSPLGRACYWVLRADIASDLVGFHQLEYGRRR